MRIGFTGAQGTGKTTLLNAIEKSDLGFMLVPSTARAALAAGFKVNRDADPLSQLVTTVSRVALEDELYRISGKTMGDRTPLDSLAYTHYQMFKVWQEPMDYYLHISKQLVVEHMHKYDHILYFPPYWKPKSDGVRDSDVVYQQNIDGIIKGLLDSYNLEYHIVPNANTEERMSWLTKTLNL